MYYGVEQSTDLRHPDTVVKKFKTKAEALRWKKEPGKNGRTSYSNPEEARNWHHTFRKVYKFSGWIDWKHPTFRDKGTATYPRSDLDRMATYLWIAGEEIHS